MPRPVDDVAKELRAIMREQKVRTLTLTWPVFSNMCERQNWTEKGYNETHAAVLAVGMVLGFGNKVVVVSEDSEFAPL
jgi:hypothetical protein